MMPPDNGAAKGCTMSEKVKYFERLDSPEFSNARAGSALRAGERVCACPSCGGLNRLPVADAMRGYVCDECADRAEQGGY